MKLRICYVGQRKLFLFSLSQQHFFSFLKVIHHAFIRIQKTKKFKNMQMEIYFYSFFSNVWVFYKIDITKTTHTKVKLVNFHLLNQQLENKDTKHHLKHLVKDRKARWRANFLLFEAIQRSFRNWNNTVFTLQIKTEPFSGLR